MRSLCCVSKVLLSICAAGNLALSVSLAGGCHSSLRIGRTQVDASTDLKLDANLTDEDADIAGAGGTDIAPDRGTVGAKPLGGGCVQASECASRFCVDGLCCDGACTGRCEACNVLASVGKCTAVTSTSSRPACDGMGMCVGKCDGIHGECQYPGSEQSCEVASCKDGVVKSTFCDGQGACTQTSTRTCGGPCASDGKSCGPCAVDADCWVVANSYCDTSNGKCAAAKPVGSTCTRAAECASGLCPDGVCLASDALADVPWPMVAGNRRHTGVSRYAGPTTGSLKVSKVQSTQFSSTQVIGFDNTVFLANYLSQLIAFDASGNAKWSTDIGGLAYSTPAIAVDGTMYLGTHSGQFSAVASDGHIKWRFPTVAENSIFNSSPAIAADGTIYVCNDTLFALKDSGNAATVVWSKSSACQDSSPAIGPDGMVYVTRGTRLNAFRGSNGEVVWHITMPTYLYGGLVVGLDGTAYLGGWDAGILVAINTADGSTKWSLNISGRVGQCALANDMVYVGSNDGTFYAVEAATGKKRWSFAAGPEPTGWWSLPAPIIDKNGVIYIGTADGTVYALKDPAGAAAPVELWHLSIGGMITVSGAIASDGTFYTSSDVNNISTLFAITGQ
jgi:outer membrane protein assembly factor BamB